MSTLNNCFASHFFFSVVFSIGWCFFFFSLSFLSFCSLHLCFLFSQIFIDTVLVRHWLIQILVGCPYFFLLSNFVFLPYFCNFAFCQIFFLCSINSDLNWCSLFIFYSFLCIFPVFFFYFLVVFFFFFRRIFIRSYSFAFFSNFHLVCLLNFFHFL